MADNLFGWDLLYRSIEKDVKTNQDLLASLVHYVLVSNGFKCIGLGESKILDGSEPKSESLPSGWNENYALRYVFQGNLYNLKGTNLDDALMLNLIRINERNVSLVQLNTRSVLKRSGTLQEMIPDYISMIDLIKKQLIDKVVISNKSKEMSSQTEEQVNQNRNSLQGSRMPARPSYSGINYQQPPLGVFPNPVGVGRADLDPFGIDPLRIIGPGHGLGSGGGMLFSPPQAYFPSGPSGPGVGLPPGAVPPGARFDPFRPPEADRFSGRRPNRPDNDEFPPPGYEDMFM